MKFRVNILKNLILKLENELLFFEENTKFLKRRQIEISKKYYVGLKIGEFLESIRELKGTIDEIKVEYQKFSQEKILDSSLTFYLYNDLDQMDDEEWEEVRAGLIEDMNDYIEEYNSYAEDFKIFDDMSQDELLEFLPFFMNDVNEEDINDFYALLNQKKKDMHKKAQEIEEQSKEEEAAPPVALSLIKSDKNDVEPDPLANIISCKYESSEGYVSINKLDEDLYSIEDDNYEVMLTADQIDFIVQQYNRIKDKPVD